MINTKHLLKVTAVWITIIYIVCFGGVALVPGIRPWFMQYALHINANMGGLAIWNVVAFLAVWLFAFLHNRIKQ